MNRSKICVALIGFGYWGKILCKHLIKSEDIRLKWICTSNSIIDTASIGHQIKHTNDLSDVLNDVSVDLVLIATPLSSHFEIAKMALAMKKNILVEKPITQNLEQVEALTELRKLTSCKIFTDYPYFYAQSIEHVHSEIKNSKIGNILRIDIDFKQFGRFNGTDVNRLLGSHALSILAKFTRLKKSSLKFVTLVNDGSLALKSEITGYNDNVKISVRCDILSPCKFRSLTVLGDRGVIQWTPDLNGSVETIVYDGIFEKNKFLNVLEKKSIKFDDSSNLDFVIDNAISAIRYNLPDDFEMSADIVKIIEMAVIHDE